jgi:hypothetical protein
MRSLSGRFLVLILAGVTPIGALPLIPYQAKVERVVSSAKIAINSVVPATGVSFVPIQFRHDSGIRPFVPVMMNGKPFLLMVHANADFYAMTTHANAESIGLAHLGKTSDYGISSAGHVSDLGRTETTLNLLQVGTTKSSNVTLTVFEIPQTPKTDGMLGINWLRDQHVIVDYDSYRIGVPDNAEASKREDAGLLLRGYVAHHMTWDPTLKGFYVMCQINGVSARLGISTVAETVVDSVFARAAGFEIGPIVDQNGGPQGALVDSFLFKRQMSIVLDGQKTAPAQPLSWDLSAYSSVQRPSGPHDDGYLGAEFMLANQAIIDFGTETLFIAVQK